MDHGGVALHISILCLLCSPTCLSQKSVPSPQLASTHLQEPPLQCKRFPTAKAGDGQPVVMLFSTWVHKLPSTKSLWCLQKQPGHPEEKQMWRDTKNWCLQHLTSWMTLAPSSSPQGLREYLPQGRFSYYAFPLGFSDDISAFYRTGLSTSMGFRVPPSQVQGPSQVYGFTSDLFCFPEQHLLINNL